MTYMAGYYFATGRNPERMGSAHPSIVPYQCFETKDKEYLSIAIGNDKLFQEFCKAVGKQELADDPRFATNPDRVLHRDELLPILETTFAEKSRSDWLEILVQARIPVGPVYSIEEMFSDPQVLHRHMLLKIQHPKAGQLKQIGIPMKFSETPPEIRLAPPLLGEHTDEILRTLLGYDSERIADLRGQGII
jgi:crotonobetainyl-CoA:carnitine CoA-transferase CaiB-like acyl-CoA transferase